MSTASQSLGYQRSLPNGSRVSFGITAPILLLQQQQQQQTHQRQVHRAQNTTINSHRVVMDMHQ